MKTARYIKYTASIAFLLLVNLYFYFSSAFTRVGGYVIYGLLKNYYNDCGIYFIDNDYIASPSRAADCDYEFSQLMQLKNRLDETDTALLYVNKPTKYLDDRVFDRFFVESRCNANADKLLERLDDVGIYTLDLRRCIKDENLNIYDMFYKTDHHWTVPAGKWGAQKTAEKLNQAGIFKVRDVQADRQKVVALLGKWGQQIAELSFGIDNRPVTHTDEAEAKSIGREITFQKDTGDFDFLRDVLVVLAVPLQARLRRLKLYCRTVTLKLTYWNMKGVTRSRSGEATDRASEIYLTASALLDGAMRSPVRLIGVSLQNLSEDHSRQLSFSDLGGERDRRLAEYWKNRLLALQQKYAVDLSPSGTETQREEHLYDVISLMRERI